MTIETEFHWSMRQVAGLSAFVVALLVASPWSAAQDTGFARVMQQQGYVPLELKKIGTGHDIVRAKLNGVSGHFIVDTGAGKTVLHTRRKSQYQIDGDRVRTEMGAGAGGQIEVEYFPVDSVELGSVELELAEIATMDLSGVVAALGQAAGFRIDGILGQDTLVQVGAVLDVRGERLYMRQPPAALATRSETFESLEDFLNNREYQRIEMARLPSGHFTIGAAINKVDGLFVLDSGARASFVHRDRLEKFSLDPSKRVGRAVAGGGAGGQLVSQDYRLDAFSISGTPLPLNTVGAFDLSAVVKHLKQESGVSVDGVIGQDVLVAQHAIIDVANAQVFMLAE